MISGIMVLSNIRTPRQFLLIVRAVIAVSALLVLTEFFSGFTPPFDMTTTPGRAAGLFENPNNAALFIVAALPVVTIGLRLRWRVFWYALVLTCVFVTFSRSGLVLFGLAILLIEAFPIQGAGATSARRLIICAVLVVLAVSLYGLVSNYIVTHFAGSLNANTIGRVRLESNVSSETRLYLLRLAWEGFGNSPFWGHGVGAGDRWHVAQSVHNMFGLMALEYGIIGLAWLCAFLWALWSMPQPFGIWAASLFVGAAPFTHNLMDGPTYALILATYAALPAIFAPPGSHAPARSLQARWQSRPSVGRL